MSTTDRGALERSRASAHRRRPEASRPGPARARTAIGLAVLAWALVAGGASAQSVEDDWEDEYYPYSREGVYVGFGGLYAMENFDRSSAVHGLGTNQNVNASDGGGPQLRFGYRYNSRIAGEVLFQHYSGFNITVKDKATGAKNLNDDFSGWSLTLNGKLYALLGRAQPYVLAGMGGLVVDNKKGDDNGFLARMGGGIDLYITDHIVVDFEVAYALPAGSMDDLEFVTFASGVQFRY